MPPPSKRRKVSAIEEISFDPAARQEYLTGFHKRKQARIKHAQEEAIRREKEERVRQRRQLREQRRQDLEKHVQEVNTLLLKANSEVDDGDEAEDGEQSGDEEGEEEWAGFDESLTVNREDEYVDEDKYTTVTVEAVNITRDGFDVPEEEDEHAGQSDDERCNTPVVDSQGTKERIWTKQKPANAKPKTKKKKFRYESKAERKVTKLKEKSRNRSQAKARRGL